MQTFLGYITLVGLREKCQVLHKKQLGILGQGYMGKHIAAFARQLSNDNQLDLDVKVIGRDEFQKNHSLEFDYLICATGNTGDFRQKILETVESNIGVALRLFNRTQVRERLIFLSSTRVYGFHSSVSRIFNESDFVAHDPQKVDFIYDGSKLLLECMAQHVGKALNIKTRVARLSNVYGRFHDMKETTLLKKLVVGAQRQSTVHLSDSPHSSKDYIYIDDALAGIFNLLVSETDEVIFNIASGKSTSTHELAKILGAIISGGEKSEEKHCGVSIEKAKKIIEFFPRTSLSDGFNARGEDSGTWQYKYD